MASNWYFAKCNKCMEAKNIFVNDPHRTEWLLGDVSTDIKRFMLKHYGCELTLGWRDDHLDQLWEEGYTSNDLGFIRNINGYCSNCGNENLIDLLCKECDLDKIDKTK